VRVPEPDMVPVPLVVSVMAPLAVTVLFTVIWLPELVPTVNEPPAKPMVLS
jgi:hypothetical protein